MKFPDSKYNIGDVVIVEPPYQGLQAHSIFTIKGIMIEKTSHDGNPEITYAMNESRWMIKESAVLRKAVL